MLGSYITVFLQECIGLLFNAIPLLENSKAAYVCVLCLLSVSSTTNLLPVQKHWTESLAKPGRQFTAKWVKQTHTSPNPLFRFTLLWMESLA